MKQVVVTRVEFAREADQAACWNLVLEANTALAIRFHVLQVAAATAEFFHDARQWGERAQRGWFGG
jgi:hypothetical protein